jgi:hypothetical protein
MKPIKRIISTIFENQGIPKKTIPPEILKIGDITEKLTARLDQRIKALKTLEAQADEKIAMLEGLINRCKNMDLSGEVRPATPQTHHAEVHSLAGKGFKLEQISRILDLPSGEVELILNLVH